MQIAEIIEKGPFDHSRTKVKAGCIIEKINGEEITLDNDITCLLNNKAGKKTLISIFMRPAVKIPEPTERLLYPTVRIICLFMKLLFPKLNGLSATI